MKRKSFAEKFTVGVFLDGKLARAMQQEKDKHHAAYAAITRAALVEYLQARGYDVEDTVEWGGNRKEDAQGQRLGMVKITA